MKSFLSIYYPKYKKQLMALVFLLLSLFTIFRVIIPQMLSISESNNILNEQKREVLELKETLSVVSSETDQGPLYAQTVTAALPRSKDVSIIFSALNSAASTSGTELREFSLEVGGLYGRAAATGGSSGIPAIEVIARLAAVDPRNFIDFAKHLEQSLPLSSVRSIDINGSQANFSIAFYYKVLDLSRISKQGKVVPLSQADRNLLNQLADWDK